jgi:predicted DNA-binding protein
MEKTINFRISEELKEELQFLAEDREIKVSSLIREIITDFIENYYEDEECIIYIPNEVQEIILTVPSNYNQ